MAKALSLAGLLAETSEPLRLADIAHRANLLPSTALRTLAELSDAGWVTRDSYDRYLLGPALLKLARSPLRTTSFAALALPTAAALAEELDLMANVQVLERGGSRVVGVSRTPRYGRLLEHDGDLVPAHHASGGIVQVAFLTGDRQAPYLAAARREGAAVERAFTRHLQAARRTGTTYLDAGMEPLIASIGSAVCTSDGACHGALVAVGLITEFHNDRRRRQITAAVRHAAKSLADSLDASTDTHDDGLPSSPTRSGRAPA